MSEIALQLEYSVEADVGPAFAWQFRTDLANWNDPPAQFALDAPFEAGSRGTTLLPGQETLHWRRARPGRVAHHPHRARDHGWTDTEFPAQFAGNCLSVPGFTPREILRPSPRPNSPRDRGRASSCRPGTSSWRGGASIGDTHPASPAASPASPADAISGKRTPPPCRPGARCC